ncbi:MAG TPA: chemotaxis protein CheB [Verrucomicrobiae bacterium]
MPDDDASLEAVVIGASAGAVDALSKLLPLFPADFPAPIIIVIHLPPDQKSAMPALFAAKCQLTVKEAEDKEPTMPGTVYFAPPNYHVLLEQDGSLSLSSDEPLNFSRPSIDVLFESAADAHGARLAGIILSGANSDGAKGLRAIVDAGGSALVQSPQLAEAFVMPTSALEACPEAQSLSLPEIFETLQNLCHVKNSDAR